MKTTRNEHGVLRPTEFTIERPAADGFHTGILATASERLGRMAAKANAASAAGGNGQTLDVDGMVTKDEVVRFAASNTAKPQQHAATLELLKLFEPEVRHVTLPTAHAPVTRERLRGAEPGQDKTRDFVPRQEPQYVATLPLTNARIDLVTSGTLKEAENPGTPRQINLIRRSLLVTVAPGTSLLLKAQTANPRGPGIVTAEQTFAHTNGKPIVVPHLPGIGAGAPTSLTAIVMKGNQVLESVRFELPSNPIVANVSLVDVDFFSMPSEMPSRAR